MVEIAQILAGLLLITVVVQAALVLGFAGALFKSPPQLISDDEAPRAAVILCLRGVDPFLADCIRGLLDQNYPNYAVRIVIDHPDDPARQIVEEVLQKYDGSHVTVEYLENPRASCSLKCSSILQVVESLDESYKFIAQLDADTVAHRNWLRELATALKNENVGAATGNRWYMPSEYGIGSLVRYGWNAAAIVQMYWYQIAWGGTLAVKTELLRETDLLEKWSQAFCEDTMLHARLKKVGKRVAFVPSLMMINREECGVSGFFHWVIRQLMTARLYHPAWLGVVGHGVMTTLLPTMTIAMLIYGVLQHEITAASYLALAFVVYELSLVVLLWPMEMAVRMIALRRGESTSWLSLAGLCKFFVAMPITQIVYPLALIVSITAKATNWREIDYRIEGPWKIEMLEYRPYKPEHEDQKSVSL